MSKIYLPSEWLNRPCLQVYNDYIRVYDTINNYDNVVHDIYFKNDYYVKTNRASYSSNTICEPISKFTDQIYYRYDFDKILLIFTILVIFWFVFPLKIFTRLFRRLSF